MKKSRFTEKQFIGFLKQAEAGMPIKQLAAIARGTAQVDLPRSTGVGHIE